MMYFSLAAGKPPASINKLEAMLVLGVRLKQFYHAIFSHLEQSDRNLVRIYLDEKEEALFYGMDRPTQAHCIRVARTITDLLAKRQITNKALIIKAALLHDIGKPANAIRTLDRVFIVLLQSFFPSLYQKLSMTKEFSGHFIKALHFHANHPELGAQIAKKHELPPQVVALILCHHQPERPEDSPELKILRQADNLH